MRPCAQGQCTGMTLRDGEGGGRGVQDPGGAWNATPRSLPSRAGPPLPWRREERGARRRVRRRTYTETELLQGKDHALLIFLFLVP